MYKYGRVQNVIDTPGVILSYPPIPVELNERWGIREVEREITAYLPHSAVSYVPAGIESEEVFNCSLMGCKPEQKN